MTKRAKIQNEQKNALNNISRGTDKLSTPDISIGHHENTYYTQLSRRWQSFISFNTTCARSLREGLANLAIRASKSFCPTWRYDLNDFSCARYLTNMGLQLPPSGLYSDQKRANFRGKRRIVQSLTVSRASGTSRQSASKLNPQFSRAYVLLGE